MSVEKEEYTTAVEVQTEVAEEHRNEVKETYTVLNKHTNVCMGNFEVNDVPLVIQKRQRLLPTDSGLSYSNLNVTTLKGSIYFLLNVVH